MVSNISKIEYGRIPRRGFSMVCSNCGFECQDLIRLSRNKNCPNCSKPLVYKGNSDGNKRDS